MNLPDWVARRNGALRQSSDSPVWFLFFENEPHYKLLTAPADGKFTCRVALTESGRRLDKGTVYPTAEDALRGGLEELRATLGW